MILETIPVGLFQCNCQILGCEETRQAIVIDPGDEVERILTILNQHDLKVKYIITTHAHIDHVGGIKPLKDATGAAALMHEGDMFLYNNLQMQANLLGLSAPPTTHIDGMLGEGEKINAGTIEANVIHTPGHTPGSLTFDVPGQQRSLFTGDTLFAGSIGRTDLWGGDFQTIMRSLHEKLLPFEDDAIVYPGHGPITTIGEERAMNPFLQSTRF
ncbi:MAG TPA: MBL fold metallo-hydrolase [Blastocatellia bacterium]|nr:MBL fold metallo-hydrolase [Blastocatellia bacterium]